MGSDHGRRLLHHRGVDLQRAPTLRGAVRIDLSTRTVQIGGIARAPSGLWMSQVGRNLYRRHRWNPERKAVLNPRSRSAVHCGVCCDLRGERNRVGQITAMLTEFERTREHTPNLSIGGSFTGGTAAWSAFSGGPNCDIGGRLRPTVNRPLHGKL